MGEEVSANHADILILACCLCSGFTDSTVFNAYGTFVSMQTGNTIFVGLGASGQDGKPYGWTESLLSIVTFALGCWVFAKFAMHFGVRKRGVLATSFFVQCSMIFIAAGLVEGGAVNGKVPSDTKTVPDWAQLAPIILLSFQAAGQIAAARNLSLNELPTVVITSLLYDLWSDPKLTAGITENVKRNRRVFGFLFELIGAIAGGWVSKATGGVQAALFIVAGIKAVIFISWMFWSRKP